MRNAYCYLNHAWRKTPAISKQIEVWSRSFRGLGWNPVVLDENIARQHPEFEKLSGLAATYPTINPRHYEIACFVRWLAFRVVGGGLMTDYDVVNRSLPADSFEPKNPLLTFLEPSRVPCAVFAHPTGIDVMLRRFMDEAAVRKAVSQIDGRPHVSDMHLCFSMTEFPATGQCQDCRHDSHAPLVHCPAASEAFSQRPKHELMESLELIRP